MENGPKNGVQIRDHLNSTTRHGISANRLGNILGKRPQFVKVDVEQVRNYSGGGNHEVCVWALDRWIEAHNSPSRASGFARGPAATSEVVA